MLSKSVTIAAAICCGIAIVPAEAAVVTNVFIEHFDDATLEAGLTNHNSTPIAGGIADLNGSNANNTAQGFSFSNASYDNFTTN